LGMPGRAFFPRSGRPFFRSTFCFLRAPRAWPWGAFASSPARLPAPARASSRVRRLTPRRCATLPDLLSRMRAGRVIPSGTTRPDFARDAPTAPRTPAMECVQRIPPYRLALSNRLPARIGHRPTCPLSVAIYLPRNVPPASRVGVFCICIVITRYCVSIDVSVCSAAQRRARSVRHRGHGGRGACP